MVKLELRDKVLFKNGEVCVTFPTVEMALSEFPFYENITIQDNKNELIAKLHDKYQAQYDDYLAQYPKREVDTFPTKQAESVAYTLDNTTPTPVINALVGGNEVAKVELINVIMQKVLYLAQQEGEMVAKRDAIKACTTQEELEAVIL